MNFVVSPQCPNSVHAVQDTNLISNGRFSKIILCKDKYTEKRFIKKVYHNRKVYDQEKKILALLQIFKYEYAVLPVHLMKNVFVFIHYQNGSLENLMSKTVLQCNERETLYEQISSMLKHLHKIPIAHGDFKAKNIVLSEMWTPYLIDFDSGVYKPSQKEKDEDVKKLGFLYRQLWCVRPTDKHHWPYNNHDKSFRNGEQIWGNGVQVRKDLKNIPIQPTL